MLNTMFPSEMPPGLSRLALPVNADEVATLPRRSFLKMAGAAGLSLGVFPHLGAAEAD